LVFFLGIAVASGPLGWLASEAGPRAALTVAGFVTILACMAYAIIGRLQAAATATAVTPAATEAVHEPVRDAALADALLSEGSAD